MKVTKEQQKIIKDYAKENNLTVDQVINYVINILIREMEN